jgi:hypothetical protein
MDEQTAAGADRFRSLLLRGLVLIGGVLAGTALAWLLSSATAAAAEPASPVADLVGAAGHVLDNSVEHTVRLGQDAKLAAQALPAAAPSVPAIEVPVPHLVAPVILVEQRLAEPAPSEPVDPAVHTVVTSTFAPADETVARHQAVPAPVVGRVERVLAPVDDARPLSGMGAPSTPARPDGQPKSEALPFGALPSGACGHDGPNSSGGACLGEGVPAVPAAQSAAPTRVRSRCVPMTARRQPGITPD